MKLVVLTSRIPFPLEKGDKLRVFHQLQFLAKHHEICLICLNDQPTIPDLSELKKITKELHIIPLAKWKIPLRILHALFTNLPFQVSYFYSAGAQKQIDQIIQSFKPNHIFCQLIRTSEYVKSNFSCAKSIDYMDAFSASAKRRLDSERGIKKLFWKEENTRLGQYEFKIFDYFNAHFVISEQDRKLLTLPPLKSATVIANGVDTSYFFNDATSTKSFDIIFAGNMSYPPNVQAALYLAQTLLPDLINLFPNIRLCFAGASPSDEVKQLASEYVKVTGWVEHMNAEYNKAKVFVAPMFMGAGLQNKLLEAMACELPVITTSLAANAFGMDLPTGVKIANTKNEFIAAIQELLLNIDSQHDAGTVNRNFITQHFEWDSFNEKLNTCITSARLSH